jgi:radical SAM superfamily enzyme YgiQ (UPF0313 family)
MYKYPQSAIEAIKSDPPDILALSNYSWNSYLSERVARLAKELNPNVITVQGGTNFPHAAPQQRIFLLQRPSTDFFVELEGEISFSNLISRALQVRNGEGGMYDSPVDGCVFIHPETRLSQEPVVVSGEKPPRIRELDVIPSPYLNGMLENFFDGTLIPFMETNRGCPFGCTFCHTGNEYFQKTNTFSTERIRDEILYIAPRAADLGIVNLHIADTNFGMYRRDREICESFKEAHDQYGWPMQIMSTTGKNNKERVIDITSIMGDIFKVNMSIQSMNEQVLSNVKRDNIKLEDYISINDHLNKAGRATKGELILGLPGETRESFLSGLDQLIETGVSTMTVFTMMLLHGTEFQEPEYRKRYEMVGKFRIVPLNFGEYAGERVLDSEEVCIQTKDMSFDDYLYIRGYALLIEALHNGRPFEELFRYAASLGINRTTILRRVYDNLNLAPEEVQNVMKGFIEETRGELWDSEEEMVKHYRKDENYRRLVEGEVGGNLIYKYKAISLVVAKSWILFIARMCRDAAAESLGDTPAMEKASEQIDVLAQFCQNKLAGLLGATDDMDVIHMDNPYDILGWIRSDDDKPLEAYALQDAVHYEFYYTEEQLGARSDLFKKYGTDTNALSKIVTRISSIESVMRKIRTHGEERPIYAEAVGDRFTRYGLAG